MGLFIAIGVGFAKAKHKAGSIILHFFHYLVKDGSHYKTADGKYYITKLK